MTPISARLRYERTRHDGKYGAPLSRRKGDALRTFITHKVFRAGKIQKDLSRALEALLESHLLGGLAVTVAVDGEFEVIPVLDAEGLPQKRNMLALIQEQSPIVVNVLRYEVSGSVSDRSAWMRTASSQGCISGKL